MLKARNKMLPLKPFQLINYLLIMISSALIISWGIEFLARKVFSLALI